MEQISEIKKYHELDPKKKRRFLIVTAISALIILPLIFYFYYRTALDRPAQGGIERVFTIEKGEGISSISDRLYKEDLINSKALFDIFVVSSNLQSKIQAGTYTVRAGSSIRQLVNQFQKGKDDVRVTFLEGWRTEEIAQESSRKLENVSYKRFLELAEDREGKLFPDTYDFNSEISEEDVIEIMLDNYNFRTAEIYTQEKLSRLELTQDQVLILASIVEREVLSDEDKKIVAGILLKRYREGHPLGADATVQYAVADGRDTSIWWPKSLSTEDLETDSPFNTRKVAGLPPFPICNPGLNSIMAVLDYQDSDYYYYLSDTQGNTHYSKTLDEHNFKVFKYLSDQD